MEKNGKIPSHFLQFKVLTITLCKSLRLCLKVGCLTWQFPWRVVGSHFCMGFFYIQVFYCMYLSQWSGIHLSDKDISMIELPNVERKVWHICFYFVLSAANLKMKTREIRVQHRGWTSLLANTGFQTSRWQQLCQSTKLMWLLGSVGRTVISGHAVVLAY